MLDMLFKDSLEFSDSRGKALNYKLINMDDLRSSDIELALETADRRKILIPEKFIKEMSIDSLFSNLPRKEVVKEIIERTQKKDFELPSKARWSKYEIPLKLQRVLIPCLVKLDRKTLRAWKEDLRKSISKEIVAIRRIEGRKHSTLNVDPLIRALRDNDTSRLNYIKLDQLNRKRFRLAVKYWLETDDKVKIEIFHTPHTELLNEDQYIVMLKPWLNQSYCCTNIQNLKLTVFQKLPQEFQYKVLSKFIDGGIKNIVPLPSVDEVKQVILPKLIADRECSEKLYLKYKIKYLKNEMLGYSDHYGLKDFFDENKIKQLTVIREGINSYSYGKDNADLKFEIKVYKWVLDFKGKKRSALCKFFYKKGD